MKLAEISSPAVPRIQFATTCRNRAFIVLWTLCSGLVVGTRSNVRWILPSLLLAMWWCPGVQVALPVATEIFCGYGVSSDTPGEAPSTIRPLNSPRNGGYTASCDYCRSVEAQLVLHDCW